MQVHKEDGFGGQSRRVDLEGFPEQIRAARLAIFEAVGGGLEETEQAFEDRAAGLGVRTVTVPVEKDADLDWTALVNGPAKATRKWLEAETTTKLEVREAMEGQGVIVMVAGADDAALDAGQKALEDLFENEQSKAAVRFMQRSGGQTKSAGHSFSAPARAGVGSGQQAYGYAGGAEGQPAIRHVPDQHVGTLIGRGGETISRLQNQSGARIQVAKPTGHPTREVTITGGAEQVRNACALIDDLVNQAVARGGSGGYGGGGGGGGASFLTVANAGAAGGGGGGGPGGPPRVSIDGDPGLILHVADGLVGGIIGRGGSTIRELQDGSGARIQVARECAPGESMREVKLYGGLQNCDTARRLIDERTGSAAVIGGTFASQVQQGGGGGAPAAPYGQQQAYGGHPQQAYGGHQQQAYGGHQQQAYGGHQQQAYGGHQQQQQQQQQGGEQVDYSAAWAAYYAAQAAAGNPVQR